jgi:MYXO-CTERM domain-containing protein
MTAGTYEITSTWASGGPSIEYKIFFNDLKRATPIIDVKLPTTGDYHNWVPDSGPHTVQLTAGVQVMTFQTVVQHLNMDYLQFSLMLDGGVAPGNPDAGTGADAAATSGSGAGSGASTGSATGSGAGSGTSVGSTGASSGTDATSGSATSGSITSGGGGTSVGSGSGTAVGGSGSAGTPAHSTGCACSVGARSSGAVAWLFALGSVVLLRRRRQML